MENSVIVVSNADGKKYKMVMKGDMSLLTVGKVKRYLQTATGLDPSIMMLRYNNQMVVDGMTGSELGLYDGAVMFLDLLNQPLQQQPQPMTSGLNTDSPYRGNGSAYGAAPTPYSAPRGSSPTGVMDIERIRREEREKLENEQRQRETEEARIRALERERYLEEQKLREETRLREQQRQEEQARKLEVEEKMQRIRALEAQLAQEREQLTAREEVLNDQRLALDRQKQAIDDAKRRDVDELRSQQRQLTDERAAVERMRGEAARLSETVRQQDIEIERLRASGGNSSGVNDPLECLRFNLQALTQELRIPPLEMDVNHTCAVTLDDGNFHVLFTYDPATQRLYIYSTILNSLPEDAGLRMKLYETLLEGSLLGRDMAGGGIGVSNKNNVVLMSASLDLLHVDNVALAALMRPFLEALRKWNAQLEQLLTGDNPHHRRVPNMTGSTPSRDGSPGGSYSARFSAQRQQQQQQQQQNSF